MASIGTIRIGMDVSVAGLKKGLSAGRSLLDRFGSSVLSVQGALTGLATAAPVAALTAVARANLETIRTQDLLARRLGVSVLELSRLEYAAQATGVEVDTFRDALSDMGEKLGDARALGGEGREAIAKLGLSIEDLLALTPDRAFAAIAQAIGRLDSQADKLNIADQLFGDAGQRLVPLLDQGAAGLAELAAEADRLGTSVSAVDAAKVRETNAALNRAGTAIGSIGYSFTVELAPYIEAAAEQVEAWATSGVLSADNIRAAIEGVGAGIGVVADAAQVLGIGFESAQVVVTAAIALVVSDIAAMADAIEATINLLPGVEVSFTDTIDAIAEGLRDEVGVQMRDVRDAWAEPWPSEGIASFFDAITTEAQAAAEAVASVEEAGTALGAQGLGNQQLGFEIQELTKDLKAQVDTFGLSGSALDIYKLKLAGASDEQLAEVTALNQQLAALEADAKAREDLAGRAEQVIESTRTPLEQFERKQVELRQLLSAGLIDSDSFDRALKQARGELASAGPEQKANAGALELGSKEARSAILAFRGGRGDKLDEVARINRQQLDQQRSAARSLSQIASRPPLEPLPL